MHQKKPVQHAIEILLEYPHGEKLRGTIYVNNYGDGITIHRFDGRVGDADGALLDISGTLSGVRFKKIERRGRRKNEGRDIAVYFAFRRFLKAGYSEPRARAAVQSHWEDRGWKGCTEQTAVNRFIRQGKTSVHGCSELVYGVDVDAGGGAIAMPTSAFEITPGQCMSGTGQGWIWAFGNECAEYGYIEFSTPLEQDDRAGDDGCAGLVPVPTHVKLSHKN